MAGIDASPPMTTTARLAGLIENSGFSASELARFWALVGEPDDAGCWPWLGKTYRGYGRILMQRRNLAAHRVSFMLAGNELIASLVLDHQCRNRACVNPAHLRQVTIRENTLFNSVGVTAINAAKTTCKRGHPLAGDNLYIMPKSGYRQCRACNKLRHDLWTPVIRSRYVPIAIRRAATLNRSENDAG